MKYSFLAAALLFFALCVQRSACLQEVSGYVRSGSNEKGIPFASVYAMDQGLGCLTDTAGFFIFSSILPERFSVRVSAVGYETRAVEIKTQDIKAGGLIIILEEHHLDLDEVIVSSNQQESQKYNSFHIETRKLADLNTFPSNSPADMIANIPGVYSATNGVGIAKPVIRGSQGMRVITLLNGLRIENQQWGGDHGMGITELGIGSVELIKGPSSLLYGADALGGVVYFIDEPYAAAGHHELNVRTQFESVSMGTRNSALYKISGNKFRINVGALYSNHADYQLPNGRYAQNSRFTDQALKFSMGTNRKNWTMHVRYTFSMSRLGIPGHSHDSVPDPSEFQVEQQGRNRIIPVQLFQNHYLSIENKFFYGRHQWSLQGGQTFNRLTEFEEKVTIPGIWMDLSNTLYQVKHKFFINESMSLVSGYQGMFQLNRNLEGAQERLLPDAFTTDNGIYSILYFSKRRWNLQAGVRYDVRRIESLEQFEGISSLTRLFGGLNYSAGAVWNHKDHTFRANISSGFRAPHLSELLSNGYHHGALRFEIGDTSLLSERSSQLDLTYQLDREHVQFMINPFGSVLANYIYLNPLDTIIDGMPTFQFEQLRTGISYGADASIHYHPHFAHWLHAELSYSYVEIRGQDINVAMIPPTRISSLIKIEFNMKRKFRLDQVAFQYNYFFAQQRVATFETETPSFSVINFGLEGGWYFSNGQRLQIKTGVRNLLNTTYIDHLSRLKNISLPFPGRNIYVSFMYQINNSKLN